MQKLISFLGGRVAEIFYLFDLRKKEKEKDLNIMDGFFYRYKIKRVKGAYIDRSVDGMELLYDLIEEMMEGGEE